MGCTPYSMTGASGFRRSIANMGPVRSRRRLYRSRLVYALAALPGQECDLTLIGGEGGTIICGGVNDHPSSFALVAKDSIACEGRIPESNDFNINQRPYLRHRSCAKYAFNSLCFALRVEAKASGPVLFRHRRKK